MSTTVKIRVGAEWIQDFHNDPCAQNNLSYRRTHADDFCNQMVAHGHTKVFEYGDDNCWETDFRHPSFGNGGDSLNFSDNVHMCYYSDHGGNWNNTFHIAFSKSHNQCLADSPTWKLGSKMLKWLILDCCDMVLNTDGGHIIATWYPPAHGIHMVFGFVNVGHDSWWNRNVGNDFGNDAGSGAVLSNAWLNAAYSWVLGDHPIALAYGVNQADAVNRRDNECINYRDFDIASVGYMAWKYRS